MTFRAAGNQHSGWSPVVSLSPHPGMHLKLCPFLDGQPFLLAVSRSWMAVGQLCQEQMLPSGDASGHALSLSGGLSATEQPELESRDALLGLHCIWAGHGISRLQKAVFEIGSAHLECFFLGSRVGRKRSNFDSLIFFSFQLCLKSTLSSEVLGMVTKGDRWWLSGRVFLAGSTPCSLKSWRVVSVLKPLCCHLSTGLLAHVDRHVSQ